MDSNHWNKVYTDKNEDQVSWFQETPTKSLELIREFNLPPSSPIIDIGGGESRLTEHLLLSGYSDLSILDISTVSLNKLRSKLDPAQLKHVQFICSDVTRFRPLRNYKLWHDRAAFHFLTTSDQILAYLQIANEALADDGFLLVSTFAATGPDKCSGLPVCKYSPKELMTTFGQYFSNIKCFEDTHVTPWGSKQDFTFCGFRKI